MRGEVSRVAPLLFVCGFRAQPRQGFAKMMSTADSSCGKYGETIDEKYPGTALLRLRNVHKRVQQLTKDDLSGDWSEIVRPKLLWAGGLRDLRRAPPGKGYTGHAFNDWNHCDLTTMLGFDADNENDDRVTCIHSVNSLGEGIRCASLKELGPGGSWSTCIVGCHHEPPHDVAHIQFRSRIAFKLVWVPPLFETFVLVSDEGERLAIGNPSGSLPNYCERKMNFETTGNGRYSREAKKLSKSLAK